MRSLEREMIDLTSDNDDEPENRGDALCYASNRPTSNLKAPQPPQTPEKRQHQPKLVDKNPLRTPSKEINVVDNLKNSKWDGFADLSQRKTNDFRTPSPFSQESVAPSYGSGRTGFSSGGSQKKRTRESSLSMGSKRFCLNSPDTISFENRLKHAQNGGEAPRYDIYREPSPILGRGATADEINHSVIILDDKDELDVIMETSSRNWSEISKKKGPPSLNPDYLLIDLDDKEDELFEELEMQAHPELLPYSRSETVTISRNLPISLPWIEKKSVQSKIGNFEVGDIVELKSSGFLRILIIVENLETDQVMLRGCRLERTRELNGVLPKKRNELYLNIEIELDDPRPPMVQSMEEFDLAQVLAPRKTRVTNQLFPSCSFREIGGYRDDVVTELSAPCAVRWKYSCKFLSPRDRWHNRWNERSLEHLKQKDLLRDDRHAVIVSDAKVRFRYRGNTILGGAYPGFPKQGGTNPSGTTNRRDSSENRSVCVIEDGPDVEKLRRSVSVIQLGDQPKNENSNHEGHKVSGQQLSQRHMSSSHEHVDLCNFGVVSLPDEGFIGAPDWQSSRPAARKLSARSPGQKYTYGDCFCGAGGATRGALMAGLKPIWGFDANNHACSSWRMNFPDAVLYEEWADQLIQMGMKDSRLRCDILHLSPPCQYFSPAHTVDGKDDEMNMASLFACGMLLDVAKPRIATLEQTFGIVMLARFQVYFNALIQMFTDRGFSIRWKVCQLQNWGLPQRRQRLIIIASCPGEVLPEFPPFTHVDPCRPESGLPPWVSVNSVIRNIPRGAPNHDIELLEAKMPLNCRPWSGDSIAPRCITTHGGQNYHPSGKRGFTLREYASLQGFPMNHQFSPMNIKKQIGNAVPPCIAKVLFSWIKKALENADGIRQEDEHSEMLHSGNFQMDAIVLD